MHLLLTKINSSDQNEFIHLSTLMYYYHWIFDMKKKMQNTCNHLNDAESNIFFSVNVELLSKIKILR